MEWVIAFLALGLGAGAYYRVEQLEKELKRRKILDQDFNSEV